MTTKAQIVAAMKGKDKLMDDIGEVNSTNCSLCGKGLPNTQQAMDNDEARRRWGSSGRRHFCRDCWPKKVELYKLLARKMLIDAGRI